MYEMLTGHTPFDGNSAVVVAMQHIQDKPEPPGQFNSDIPAALEEIILQCLEKEPGSRFPDGSQLARALEKFGDAKVSETAPISPRNIPIPASSTQTPSHISKNGQSDKIEIVKSSVSSSHHRQNSNASASLVHHLIPNRTYWCFVSIITISILLATMFISGFSVFLAVQLRFIHVPFISATSPTTGLIQVPDLRSMSWVHAEAISKKLGFQLVLVDGQLDGIVVDQNPRARDKAAIGSMIGVKMGILISSHISGVPTEKKLPGT
jgi:serine/threonine protein kinase